MNWSEYKRKGIIEMIPYSKDINIDMNKVSISLEDKENGSPKIGDMIARNPKNRNDMWLVAEKYFTDNYEEVVKNEN